MEHDATSGWLLVDTPKSPAVADCHEIFIFPAVCTAEFARIEHLSHRPEVNPFGGPLTLGG
jgi:hypothetical protein